MGRHILVIDDARDITQLIEITLTNENYQVSSRYSAAEALSFLKEHSPDLVLLDIMLPDQNGIELLQTIKSDYPFLPVVMITAFAEVNTAVDAMKKGASDYICKPFKVDELKKVVEQNLQMRPVGQPMNNPPTLEEVEKIHIEQTLKNFDGNRRKAAEALGISLRALYYKIKQYDLD
ncbi:MAG: response regulator [Bacillaceae bacterium]|nr:response regulator [Bacillaceae bacterium]